MTDDQLRLLVRDAVRRHLGAATGPSDVSTPAQPPAPPRSESPWAAHASHAIYLSLVNVDGACVIEPSVRCDHCGYCKSHGH